MPLLLAVLLGLSLMLTGCGGDSGTVGENEASGAKPEVDDSITLSTWKPMGGNRPVVYYMNGGVMYEYVTDEDVASKMADLNEMSEEERANIYVNGSYCTIDGLVDQEVEDRINQQIYDLYLDLCAQTELPAYRGVKTVQKLGTLQDINIYPWNIGYSGNLLSVGIQKCWTYGSDETWNWVRDMEYLTFDMKTGGQVTLASLFGDNVDYVDVINQQVKKQLPDLVDEAMGSYEHNGEYIYDEGGLVQVTPFTGIREDQPFAITYQGIVISFDEHNPEFDTEFGMYSDMVIYYNDIKYDAVYPVRFPGEQELYTNKMDAVLVYDYNLKTETEREQSGEKNLDKHIEVMWPASLSVEDRDAMISKDRSEFMDEINGWYINNYITIEENWGYLSYLCNITDIGGYYNVEHNLFGGTDGNTLERGVRRIYDKKTLKEVPVDYIFMPGFDLRAVLIDQVAENMVNHESYIPGSVLYTLEEAWDGRMASLSTYGISFEFPINNFGGRISIYKNYTDLGLENLRMFQ